MEDKKKIWVVYNSNVGVVYATPNETKAFARALSEYICDHKDEVNSMDAETFTDKIVEFAEVADIYTEQYGSQYSYYEVDFEE